MCPQRATIVLQNMKQQMKKDIKVLMDVSRAADGPGAAAMDGLVRFEGAFLSPATQEATIVLEYMNGGSLEDVKRRVRFHHAIPPLHHDRVCRCAAHACRAHTCVAWLPNGAGGLLDICQSPSKTTAVLGPMSNTQVRAHRQVTCVQQARFKTWSTHLP